MGYTTDYQTIDSKLSMASQYFQELENRYVGRNRSTPFCEAAFGIKDKNGRTISEYEAFKILFSVMCELDCYGKKGINRFATEENNCVRSLAMVPLMYSYERKKAGELYAQLSFRSFTLGDMKDTDFIRYALLTEAYREILRNERNN